MERRQLDRFAVNFDYESINDFPSKIIGNLIDGLLGISRGTILIINYFLVMF